MPGLSLTCVQRSYVRLFRLDRHESGFGSLRWQTPRRFLCGLLSTPHMACIATGALPLATAATRTGRGVQNVLRQIKLAKKWQGHESIISRPMGELQCSTQCTSSHQLHHNSHRHRFPQNNTYKNVHLPAPVLPTYLPGSALSNTAHAPAPAEMWQACTSRDVAQH